MIMMKKKSLHRPRSLSYQTKSLHSWYSCLFVCFGAYFFFLVFLMGVWGFRGLGVWKQGKRGNDICKSNYEGMFCGGRGRGDLRYGDVCEGLLVMVRGNK